MPHDCIDSYLVARFPADRFQRMAKRVEIPATVDAQLLKEFGCFLANRIVAGDLDLAVIAFCLNDAHPGSAEFRDEDEFAIGCISWSRTSGNCLFQSNHSFRPKRTAPVDPGLWPWEINPSRF